MSRDEYLSELYGRLRQRVPEGELNHIMKYYEEYFDEGGPDKEQDIIAELGAPEDLARQILNGHGMGSAPQDYGRQVMPRRWTAGKIVALVLLSPLWVTLLVGIGAAMIGLVACVGLVGVGLMLCGIFSAWCGFTALFTPGFTTTMFFCGLGLVLAAVGVLVLTASIAMGRGVCKAVGSFCRWLFVGRKVWVQA